MTGQLPTNNSGNILSAIPALVQLFAGSGKQTQTSTSSNAKNPNSIAVQALTELLGSDAANPNAAGNVVSKATQNAIQQMLLAGVPSIGAAQAGSGIYNATATEQSMNNLLSSTAAKASELEVNQTNQAAQTRTGAAAALNDMTGTSSQTNTAVSKQDGAIDPLTGALTLGGLVLGNSVLKGGLKGLGLGGDSASGSNFSADFTPVIKQPDTASLLENFLTPNFQSDLAGSLRSSITDQSGNVGTGGFSQFTDALTSVFTQNALGTALSALGGLFGGSSSSANSGNSSDSGSTMGTAVICSRMYELGYLQGDDLIADTMLAQVSTLHYPQIKAWYHSWAYAYVDNYLHGNTLMSKLAIKLTSYLVLKVTKECRAIIGMESKGSYTGRLILAAFYYFGKNYKGVASYA